MLKRIISILFIVMMIFVMTGSAIASPLKYGDGEDWWTDVYMRSTDTNDGVDDAPESQHDMWGVTRYSDTFDLDSGESRLTGAQYEGNTEPLSERVDDHVGLTSVHYTSDRIKGGAASALNIAKMDTYYEDYGPEGYLYGPILWYNPYSSLLSYVNISILNDGTTFDAIVSNQQGSALLCDVQYEDLDENERRGIWSNSLGFCGDWGSPSSTYVMYIASTDPIAVEAGRSKDDRNDLYVYQVPHYGDDVIFLPSVRKNWYGSNTSMYIGNMGFLDGDTWATIYYYPGGTSQRIFINEFGFMLIYMPNDSPQGLSNGHYSVKIVADDSDAKLGAVALSYDGDPFTTMATASTLDRDATRFSLLPVFYKHVNAGWDSYRDSTIICQHVSGPNCQIKLVFEDSEWYYTSSSLSPGNHFIFTSSGSGAPNGTRSAVGYALNSSSKVTCWLNISDPGYPEGYNHAYSYEGIPMETSPPAGSKFIAPVIFNHTDIGQ